MHVKTNDVGCPKQKCPLLLYVCTLTTTAAGRYVACVYEFRSCFSASQQSARQHCPAFGGEVDWDG